MLFRSLAVASFAAGAFAGYHGNLNYRSPSFDHPSMGIDVAKVVKRHAVLEKRQANSTWDPAALNFTHGVASGDPYADSVILWTRISPQFENDASNVTVEGTVALYSHETERYIRASTRPVCVDWQVSTDSDFSGTAASGRAYTTSDIDYTVKVEAEGLSPFTVYYYQFTVCGSNKRSPVGRTKTSPAENDDTTQIGLAVFSCSNYPTGYFNAYGNAARRDEVDYFVHLGDYIYETSTGVLGRDARATNPPRTIFTLFDYRTRIAQYRTDADLLLSHQNFAWVTTWDDHEVANNAYRDGSSAVNNTEDSFLRISNRVSVDQRKMNAVRAYFEWMPIRQVNLDNNLRIWRNLRLGKLLDLTILDTRNYDRSITDLNYNENYIPRIANDAGRTLMGSDQENWFYRTLRESKQRGATWRVIGNQIVFSRINVTSWFGTFENPFNTDQWDGYLSNRNRTYQVLYGDDIGNNIMLAGDSHANWVSDLVQLDAQSSPNAALNGQDDIPAYDQATGEGSIGVEFAVTAVSSSGFGGTIASATQQADELTRDNSELMWNEGYFRGYLKLTLTPEEARAEYYGAPTVRLRNAWDIPLGNFTTLAGSNRLARPVGGGRVTTGSLKDGVNPGVVTGVNGTLALNTETGEWGFPPSDLIAGGNFITYARRNTTA